eukprot:g10469.t1
MLSAPISRRRVGGDRLPVTVLSGFLGSGKTTTLTHILNNNNGCKIALIVNDMASVNVDALNIDSGTKEQFRLSRIQHPATATPEDKSSDGHSGDHHNIIVSGKKQVVMPKMVSLQNGCVCCTLREDLVEQIAELANKGDYDYLIIESTGIAEPVPVAQTFCHSLRELEEITKGYDIGHELGEDAAKRGGVVVESEQERRKIAVQAIELQKLTRLDTMVTVVDAAAIWDVLQCGDSLRESKWSKAEAALAEEAPSVAEDLDRSIADLLIAQIEFANVVLLNKRDLLFQRGKDAQPANLGAKTDARVGAAVDGAKEGSCCECKTGDADEVQDMEGAAKKSGGGSGQEGEPRPDARAGECVQRKTELIEDLIHSLNPEAKVYWSEYGQINPEWILDTKLFDFETATVSKGWVRALAGPGGGPSAAGPSARQQISSVVFRATRPFHPQRLFDILGGFGHLAENVFVPKTAASGSPGGLSEKTVFPETAAEDQDVEMEDAGSLAPEPVLSCCGIVLNKDEIEKYEAEQAEKAERKSLEVKKKLEEEAAEEDAPFDPTQVFKNVFRSKGQVWLANCAGFRIMWESVGREFYFAPGRPFDSAVAEAGYDPAELGAVATAAASGFLNKGSAASGQGKDVDQRESTASTLHNERPPVSGEVEELDAGDEEMHEQGDGGADPESRNCTAYALTMLVDNLVVTKPEPESSNLALYGSQRNQHPVWGDRGTELVFIGVALNEDKILSALNSALVSEEEMAVAANDKQKWEAAMSQAAGDDHDPFAVTQPLTPAQVQRKTGGLLTRWDRFWKLEDPFFKGTAAQRLMEFDLEDDEEGNSDAGAEHDMTLKGGGGSEEGETDAEHGEDGGYESSPVGSADEA